ncbi:MAG: hypothetical protein AXA67_12460 [Methylothermaceae bacteria B42]|nr:MAG: hypothetical protein AXA67_12460 [Methylothermaceae bacteria B42]HHJ37965.1 hypothetical protein [Methylothermaceae bacterium]
MSYILKAIRKAELERQRDNKADLKNAILQSQQPPPEKHKHRLLIILLICNLTAFLLFFWYHQRQNKAKKTDTVATIESITLARQNPPAFSKTGIIKSSKHSSEQVKKTKVASVENKVSLETLLEKKPVRGEEKSKTKITTESLKPKISTNHKSIIVAKKPKTALVKDQSKPIVNEDNTNIKSIKTSSNSQIVQSHPSVNRKIYTEQRIPFLDELPLSFQHMVPKLNINVHAYSDDPQERFIIVDMVRYEEGQKVTQDLKLEEIRPDELVLTFSGKTFRIKRP